jgi:CRISPR-associated RAMP protein (TIGR02581 family)
MNLDKIFNQVVIDVRLAVNRTLVVGSGQGDITPGGIDIPQIRMTTGRQPDFPGEPYLPGSSLKGAIRATCETVIRTFIDSYRASGILHYDDAPEEQTDCGKENEPLCMMCDTFGNTNRISKVSFDDAFLTPDSWNLLREVAVQSRTGVSISRQTGAVKTGALYSVEFIPRGAEFEFQILCTNILPAELKLLLLAMELFNRGRFKLGGQKSRGMGSVTFEVAKVTTYLPKLYRFDPFARENGGYRWLTGEEVIERILERGMGEEIETEMVEASVIYEVPAGAWSAVSSEAGITYLRDDLVPRLYPVQANEQGMFQVKVCPDDSSTEAISLGRYSLRPGGDLEHVTIEEQINRMEYAITIEGQSERLLTGTYHSAFEFLGGIEKASRATEELRLPGAPRLPVVVRQADAEGRAGPVKVMLKVAAESKRVHNLLVWLGLVQMLIAPPEEG